MTFIQRRINVDATSCMTLHRRWCDFVSMSRVCRIVLLTGSLNSWKASLRTVTAISYTTASVTIPYINKQQHKKKAFIAYIGNIGPDQHTHLRSLIKAVVNWIHLVNFLPVLTREATFASSRLLYCSPIPFWKGVYSKRQEFASCLLEKNPIPYVEQILSF